MPLTSDKRLKFTHDYNIFNNMKCPYLLGTVGNNTKASVVIGNTTRNILNYAASYPVSGYNTLNAEGSKVQTATGPFYTGPDYAMGSNYFVQLGKCSDESEDSCAGKKRWVYVRNIPTGKNPLAGNASFKDAMGCDIQGLTEGRGLVLGIFEDLSDIQPLNLMNNISGNGNFGDMKCKKVRLPVGSHIYDRKMECKDHTFRSCQNESWWMEERCSPSYKYTKSVVDTLPVKIPGAKPLGYTEEEFRNSSGGANEASVRKSGASIFVWACFAAAVMLLLLALLKAKV